MGLTIHQSGTLLIILIMYLSLAYGSTDDRPTRWYIGCHVTLSNRRQTFQRYFIAGSLTPAKCAKTCRDQSFNYALLAEKLCYCDTSLQRLNNVEESYCSTSCKHNPRSRCGGPRAYSVFSTVGPYITSAVVTIYPSIAVQHQTIQIRVKVILASEATFPTGLRRFNNVSFDQVSVSLSLAAESLPRMYTVDIIGVEGNLEVEHTYEYPRLYVIDALARNALSSEDFRNYVKVVAKKPNGLTVSDVTYRMVVPQCTPSYIKDSSGLDIEHLESTSVVVGEMVKFEARLFQGVNATFRWNFCGLETRRSRPHLTTCEVPVCQTDKQEFDFTKHGLCKVTVKATNGFGFDRAFISVIVVAPEIRDLSVRVEDCDEKCSISLPTWHLSQRVDQIPRMFHSPQNPLPPWLVEASTQASPPPTTTSPTSTLPPGTFKKRSKVCFRAIAYVSLKENVEVHVRFGDGNSLQQALEKGPSQFFNPTERNKRSARPNIGPYDAGPTPPSDMVGKNSQLHRIHGLRNSSQSRSVQICYHEGCMLKFYFFHIYERIGRYNIDVQISNSTGQIAARLHKPIRIVGRNGITWRKLNCERIVSSGKITTLSVKEEGNKQTYSWLISRRKSATTSKTRKGRPAAVKWQRHRNVVSASPLRHTFFTKGVYRVSVNDSKMHDHNSAYCVITVEDRVRNVRLGLRPDIRFVSTTDVVYADLKIKQGTNFSVTWLIGNNTFTDGKRYNAPYKTTFQFTSTFVGCKTVTAVISNILNRVETSAPKPVCSEERITGLRLFVPGYLEVGEPAIVIVTIASGSHVSLQLDVACNIGVHLHTLKQKTEATTGPATFNFTTSPFPEPGSIRVVARARNHVTVGRKLGPMVLRKRRDIVVGKVIQNFTIELVSTVPLDKASNNIDNILITLIKGAPDKAGGTLYKWVYPNDTEIKSTVTLYTASPTIKIRPRCNPLLYNSTSSCMLRVTATSGISKASAQMQVALEAQNKTCCKQSICHPLTIGWRDEFWMEAVCESTSSTNTSYCTVKFFDTANSVVRFSANSSTTVGHTFLSPGLWEIQKDDFSSNGRVSSFISYVSVQEKLTRLKIKGDSVLVLDETPSGSWRAITGRGSHLVFQWKIRQHGTKEYLITSTKVTCVRMFGYHFKQWGFYDVIVDAFNDVSHMQISTTVEVRHAATYFDVTTTPTYLGRNSLFILSVNVSQPFTLDITWMKDGDTESYTQDQLNIVGEKPNPKNITNYALHHLYPIDGEHQFLFMLEWEASDDVITREFTGYSKVYDMKKNPPVVLKLYQNNKANELHFPYHVHVDDVVKVDIKANNLVTSIIWNVESNQGAFGNTVNVTQGVIYFQFVASSSGNYAVNVTSYPDGIGVVRNIFAFNPITQLVLERPKPRNGKRHVNYCKLERMQRGNNMQCTAAFVARSDGDNIMFRFKFQRLRQENPLEDDIVDVEVAGGQVQNHYKSDLRNVAEIEHTFTVEGVYNISVCGLANDYNHGNSSHLVPLMEAALSSFFFAEALPNVSLPRRDFFVEAGNVTKFKLTKHRPNQILKADWSMGDGTTLKDAGMEVEHVYKSGGIFNMRVTIYNRVYHTYLNPIVEAEERITSVVLSTDKEAYNLATGASIRFEAEVTPPGAGSVFEWYLNNDGEPIITYSSSMDYRFLLPETYLAKVIVKNKINEVSSEVRLLTVSEPVTGVDIKGPSVVEVGQQVSLKAVIVDGSDVRSEWDMGDGTIYTDEVKVTHTYTRTGVYAVSFSAGNKLFDKTRKNDMFVMEKWCPLPTLKIPGIGSKEHYRFKPLRFEANLEFNCSQVQGVVYKWTVAPDQAFAPILRHDSKPFASDKQVLEVPPGKLHAGRYEVSVTAYLVGTVLFVTDSTIISIKESKPVAKISGGSVRTVARDSKVIIDASQSYDPDSPESHNLLYNWECYVLNVPDIPCFKNHSQSLTFSPSRPSSTSSSVLRELSPSVENRNDLSINSWLPTAIKQGENILSFQTNLLIQNAKTFIFRCKVSKPSRPQLTSFASVIIKLTEQKPILSANIDCPLCYQSSMIRHQGVLLAATCEDCNSGSVTYDWSISLVEDNSKSFYSNQKLSCAPPDGSGWVMSWAVNTSSSVEEKHFEETNRTDTLDFYLHPDDANFTGVLTNDTDILDPQDAPFFGVIVEDVPGVLEGTPFLNLGSRPSLENVDHKEEEEKEEIYFATIHETGRDDRYDEDNNDLLSWPSIHEGEEDSYEEGSTSAPRGSNLREGFTSESSANPHNILHSPNREPAGGRSQPQASWSQRPTGRFHFVQPQPERVQNVINKDWYTNGHTSQPDGLTEARETGEGGRFTYRRRTSEIRENLPTPTDSFVGDRARDASVVASSLTVNHYQDVTHTRLPLDAMATISHKGEILLVRPDVLEEGKTYAVSVDISKSLDSRKQAAKGKASYYVRVVRGPSYGECGIVSVDHNNTFRVHCLQWRNKQSDELDTDSSLNEMLYYEVSYSLSEIGVQRQLYYGISHDRTFQLPASDNPVYIFVQLHNSLGAKTKVCSFPFNVTRPGRKSNQSAILDLNYVFTSCVGRRSKLHHLVLKNDHISIFALVNVLFDSLPSGTSLSKLIKTYPESVFKMREISISLLKALKQISFTEIARKSHILSTLSRLLELDQYFNMDAISIAAEIVINNLKISQEHLTLNLRSSTKLKKLAEEINNEKVRDKILQNSMFSTERLIASIHQLTSVQPIKENGKVASFMKKTARLEECLRNFFLDSTRAKQSFFGFETFSAHGLAIFAQNAKESLTIEVEQLTVGAVVPEKTLSFINDTAYMSALAYFNQNPFISTNHSAIKMDKKTLSVWMTYPNATEIHIRGINPPIMVYLPPRKEQLKTLKTFPHLLTRVKMSVHQFNVTLQEHGPLHIEVRLNNAANRPFTVAAAVSTRKLSLTSPTNDSSIIEYVVFPSRRRSRKDFPNSKKFTLASSSIETDTSYYITLWNIDQMTTEQRRRYAHQNISYAVDVWWSDCYFWNDTQGGWSRNGCKALSESTVQQTVCSTSHLSTFSSTFHKIPTVLIVNDVEMLVTVNALKPCLLVLICVAVVFLSFLGTQQRILKHRRLSDVEFDEDDNEKLKTFWNWLRWMLGTDNRGEDGLVPVILRDNKVEHEQRFEITVQTGSWPGSGTTSLARIILFGENGQYEARELAAPNDREMGYESQSLKKSNKHCFFETGSSKTFVASFKKNLGPLWKICIWHSHSGLHPRWYIDHVNIHDTNSKQKWFFPCSSWLALDRDLNRICVVLHPLERKPEFFRHLAMRARNYMFDLHSVLPIFACARWGALNRFRRVIHCFALCVVVLALTTVKNYFFIATDFGTELTYFSAESLVWGLGIGVIATIFLVPPQLILRYTERDERISISIEDVTNGKESYESILGYGFENHLKGDQTGAPGGLRKTAAIPLNLEQFDGFMDDNIPTSSNLVTHWLREWDSDSIKDIKDLNHPYAPQQDLPPSSLRKSFSSCDDEVRRCMMTSSPTSCVNQHTIERTIVDSYYGDCSHCTTHESYLTNTSHSRLASEDLLHHANTLQNEFHANMMERHSRLAMDGPVLVPCEKLDPMPTLSSAPLPRQCETVAMAYYMLLIAVSSGGIIYGALYILDSVDFSIWLETAFFAMFWTVIVVEIIAIGMLALFSTAQDLITDVPLPETLKELFPSVAAAAVDDYVYKPPAESRHVSHFHNDDFNDVLDHNEIHTRISERRRNRYLRNMLPPYDKTGKWKNENNPLRAKAREMRRFSAAKRASDSWLELLFLVLMMIGVVALLTVGSKERLRLADQAHTWFNDGFEIDQDLIISVKSRNHNKVTPFFQKISDYKTWRTWFLSNFMPPTSESDIAHTSVKTKSNRNNIMLGFVKVSVLNRQPKDLCKSLPRRMQMILDSHCVNQTSEQNVQVIITDSGNEFHAIETLYIDLLRRNKTIIPEILRHRKIEAIQVEFVTYNKAIKKYSLAVAFSRFSVPFSDTKLSIYSASLDYNNKEGRDVLIHFHLALILWVAYVAIKSVMSTIERNCMAISMKAKLDKKSFHKTSCFSCLVDLLMWFTIVAYLIFSTIARVNNFRAVDILEKSGHLYKDPGKIIGTVVQHDIIIRCILGFWTALLVMKGLTITVNHHGLRSSLTNGIVATCMSGRNALVPYLLPFVIFNISFALFGYLFFNVLFHRYSSFIYSIQETVFSSVWLGLIGGSHNKFPKLEDKSESYIVYIYFFVIFLVTRVLLKACIVASHQWYYKKSKLSQHCLCNLHDTEAERNKITKKNNTSEPCKRKKIPKDKENCIKTNRNASLECYLKLHSKYRYVTFQNIWNASFMPKAANFVKRKMGQRWRKLSQKIGKTLFSNCCKTAQNDESGTWSSSQSLPGSISHLKEQPYSYDKSKLDESGYSTCEFPDMLDADTIKRKLPKQNKPYYPTEDTDCELYGDIALSEIELQVEEFANKTTAILDDFVGTLTWLNKIAQKKALKQVTESRSESRIKLITDTLIILIKMSQKGFYDDDDATVITSFGSSICSSPMSLLDKREMRKVKNQECRGTEPGSDCVTASQEFSDLFLGSDVDRIIHVQPLHNEDDKPGSKTFTPDTPSKAIRERKSRCSGGKIHPLKDDVSSSSWSIGSECSNSSKSLPSLTTDNIARHNRQIHRGDSDQLSTTGTTEEQCSSLEPTSSNTTISKSSLRKNSSNSRPAGILKSLLTLKRNRNRSKSGSPVSRARALRRSQTIFIDVKDLPVMKPTATSYTTNTSKKSPTDASAFPETSNTAKSQKPTFCNRAYLSDSSGTINSPPVTLYDLDEEDVCYNSGILPGCVVEEYKRNVSLKDRAHSDNERFDATSPDSDESAARGRSCPPLQLSGNKTKVAFLSYPPTISEDNTNEEPMDIMEELKMIKQVRPH